MSKNRRLELHFMLCDILGSKNVYFQPPESAKLEYPCIIYNLSDIDIKYADNRPYAIRDKYAVTVVDKDPDSNIRRKILKLPQCKFSRFFTSDNLNHWMFDIYY